MRIILKMKCLTNSEYTKVTNTELQGFVYSLLKDTRYNNTHNLNGFKFFTFSNIFPPTPYKEGEDKTFVISSPNNKLLKTMYYRLKTIDIINLKGVLLRITKVTLKKSPKKYNTLYSSTPIVLYKNKEEDIYYSFKKGLYGIDFFFKRLKDNILKKYNAYYDDEYDTTEPLFLNYSFKKEVAHSLKHKNYRFLVIGSQWTDLICNPNIPNHFYKFLYETGLGEKNSLGYGFINREVIKSASRQ